ncbi:MAG: hypothetical protein PHS31_05680 [Victivallaceae bacterium]|nr:hypothetical protein [Victivallaceae bacterium]MDD4181740.1 hypothetical protein [Victivallaceae bacterium]
MRNYIVVLFAIPVLLLSITGCKLRTENTVKVEPIEIKPIHITINVKVEKELDDFFSDIDEPQK